jgi:DNA gyrase/topoisomerase IV subunit B
MNVLKVEINREEGSIAVLNNGAGIPIEIHKDEKIYVPELIFGHLLTSSNYDVRTSIDALCELHHGRTMIDSGSAILRVCVCMCVCVYL